jgi:phage gpG-like protein
VAGTTATITLDQLAKRLNDAGNSMGAGLNLAPAMKQCALMVSADAQLNIAEGHAPDGTPYPPLKRPRKDGSNVPLRDKGLLLASITPASIATEIGPMSFSAGTNLEYAAIHNFGGTISIPEKRRTKPWVFPGPGGKMIFTRHIRAHTVTIPQRQFLGWSDQLLQDCADACAEYAAKLLSGRLV